jgi:hypothetical protein
MRSTCLLESIDAPLHTHQPLVCCQPAMIAPGQHNVSQASMLSQYFRRYGWHPETHSLPILVHVCLAGWLLHGW